MLFQVKITLSKYKAYAQKQTAHITYNVLLLVFLLHFQIPFSVAAQNNAPKFTHLTTNEGLSQGHVSAILKDSKGFMWFATDGGLNKYDGYKYTVYKHDADKSSSISNDIVTDVLEDNAGNIWAATRSGLDKLDRQKNEFIHFHPGIHSIVNVVFEDRRKRIWAGTSDGLYVLNTANSTFQCYKNDRNNTSSLSDDFIYKIAEDNYGDLWIATKKGLNRFNMALQSFSCYKNNPLNSTSIGSDWIMTVYNDTKGNIWAGTIGGGIALFDRKKNSFVVYRHDPQRKNSIALNDIHSFCEDESGNLWIGTDNGGISVFNYAANSFITYKNDPYNAKSLSNNSISSLYKDDQEAIWVGTYSEGVNMLPKNGTKFTHYNQSLTSKNGLNDHNILSIAENTFGFWIGTDGGGLNRFNKQTQNFTHYVHDVNNKNSINSNYVVSVIEVDKGLLGLGLYQGGFDLFDVKKGRFFHHIPEKNNLNSLSSSSVSALCKSRNNKIWIGTWGEGLNLYDRKKNTFKHYVNNPKNPNSIVSNSINYLLEDIEGNLWIGSDNGLDKFIEATNTFVHYRHSDKNKKSLSHNFVQFIFEDKAKTLWIGTSGGLNSFDKKNETFTAYNEKDGLANNTIQSILQDRHNNLWLASNGGLAKFNPVTKAIRNYNISDGLQGKEFKAGSCFKDSNGQMFFGGINGFNAFYPDSLQDNKFIPPVVITDFQIFNKQVIPGSKGAPIKQEISETKQITLSYKQSTFSFEFSALNYILPEKNQYTYKLEGFDKEWINSGNKRSATYTNIDPGKYVFHVLASNNDGVWNQKGTSVTITIMPPFWMKWWFKAGLLLAIISSAALFYLFRINTIKKQKIRLEQKVHEQTGQLLTSNEEERKARQEADQANRAKSVFLAIMSHEIRTPMNGVIGMASLLMQTELTGEQKNYASTISTCGESLLSVINGILDFSKIESGKMELENKPFDLQICIEEALDIFSFKASETGIKLTYHIDSRVPTQIAGDCLRLRQVLINLVSNAIKFTPQGEISIVVYLLKSEGDTPIVINFEVRDTGIGIAPDKIERLFKAFSQVDSSTTRQHGGTGLGLVICEKLVTLMGGNISVTSIPEKGTTFTFSIQTTAEKEIVGNEADNLLPLMRSSTRLKSNQIEEQKLNIDFSQKYPLSILIAEDNPINALIINKILNKLGYRPETAVNGQDAVNMLSLQYYDLILMDVQMPEMDGLEATRAIRQNYNDQPVIIAMTANAMQGDKEECIKAGMDDYLSKPISLDALINMLKKWSVKISIA